MMTDHITVSAIEVMKVSDHIKRKRSVLVELCYFLFISGNPLVFCHDINECTRQSDECHEDAYCINTESSYDLGFQNDFS